MLGRDWKMGISKCILTIYHLPLAAVTMLMMENSYDGESVVYAQTTPGSILEYWWHSYQLYQKYGHSPRTAGDLYKSTVNEFSEIYTLAEDPNIATNPNSIQDLVQRLNLETETTTPASFYLRKKDVSDPFSRDLVNAWARAATGQNLGSVNAFTALRSLYTGTVETLAGEGTGALFNCLLKASGAEYISREVTHVRRNTLVWNEQWRVTSSYEIPFTHEAEIEDATVLDMDTVFDHVILAAPFHSSGVHFEGEQLEAVPHVMNYTMLHATFFTIDSRGKVDSHCSDILTTLQPGHYSEGQFRPSPEDGGSAGVYSIRLWRMIELNGKLVDVYKALSPAQIDRNGIMHVLYAVGCKHSIGILAQVEVCPVTV